MNTTDENTSTNTEAGPQRFDVFLSHNSKDKVLVRALATELKSRGISVWLDEWELVPGRVWQDALEEVILTTRSVAVLYGPSGLGPWEQPEMRGCLSEFVRRGLPVIPVLLPGAGHKPSLPLFLQQFTWVDLRQGIEKEGIARLAWGITGTKTHDLYSPKEGRTANETSRAEDGRPDPSRPRSQQPLPGIACSCIVSILAATAIARAGANFDQALILWLIYAVTAGTIVNYREGLRERQLWLYSLPSPVALVLVVIYRMTFLGEAPLSGVRLSFEKPRTLLLLVIFWVCSAVGVWLFAHSRHMVFGALKNITSLSKSKRSQIESALHWVVRMIGVSYLVVKAFLNF